MGLKTSEIIALIGGGGLNPGVVQTGAADYQASSGELVMLAILGYSKRIKAPPSPQPGTRWGVYTMGDVGLSDVVLDGNGRPLFWGGESTGGRPFRGTGVRANFVYVAALDQWHYEPGNIDSRLCAVFDLTVTAQDATPPQEVFRFRAFHDGFCSEVGNNIDALYDFEVVIQALDTGAGFQSPSLYQVIRAQFQSHTGSLGETFRNVIVDRRNDDPEQPGSILGDGVGGSFVVDGDDIVFFFAGRENTVDGGLVAGIHAKVNADRLLDVSGAPP